MIAPRTVRLLALSAAASLCLLPARSGDDFTRKGKGELYVLGEYTTGADASFNGGDQTVDFDSGYGGGLGLAYCLTDHWMVSTDIATAWMDVEGESFGTRVQGDTSMFNWNVNVDYNVLKTRLTPFVRAAVGLTHFNGVLGDVDFSETDFTYGAGGGLRWDITDHWVARAAYLANWTNLQDSDDATLFHTFVVSFGYVF